MKLMNYRTIGLLFLLSACVSKDPQTRSQLAGKMSLASENQFALAKPKDLQSIHYVNVKDKCATIVGHIKAFHEFYLEPQDLDLNIIDNPCTTKDFKDYKVLFSVSSDKKIYTFQLDLDYVLGTKEITTEKFETYKTKLQLVGSSGRMGPWNFKTANSNTNLDRIDASFKAWFGRERVYANTYSCALQGRDYFNGDACAYPEPKDLSPDIQASYTELIETQVSNYIREFSDNYLGNATKLSIFKMDRKHKDHTTLFHKVEKGNKSILFALVLRFKFKDGYYFITDNRGNPVKAQGEVRRLDSYEFYRVDQRNNKFKLADWNPMDRNLNIIHPNIAHYHKSLKGFLNKVLVKERELSNASE